MKSYGMVGSFQTEDLTFLDYTEMGEEMSRIVWECRNLPDVRKWMANPKPIPYDGHIRFVNELKYKPDAKYYAVLLDGSFVGSINLHVEEEGTVERGIYIHPDHWGRGLARKICMAFYSWMRKNMGIRTVTTKVLKDNLGSNSLECSLGASKVSEDSVFVYYICNLEE